MFLSLFQTSCMKLVSSLLKGLRCHLDDACISHPCHSGANCDTSPINGDPVCTCRQGWSGADCSIDINECNESEYALFVTVEFR